MATGGLDTNIIIWDLQKSGEHPIILKGAAIPFSLELFRRTCYVARKQPCMAQ